MYNQLQTVKYRQSRMKSRIKYWILFLLIPLSDIKALFYNSDLKVSWYLFSNNKRYLCNVLEDYSNIIIFGVIFYFMAFVKFDLKIKKICLFLFIINALDFIHLGLMDMEYFIPLKLVLALIIFNLCNKLKIS